MAVIATFGEEEPAARAVRWLKRCHVPGARVEAGAGVHLVTVPSDQASRALDLLGALDHLGRGTAGMGRPPWWQRLVHAESVGMVIAVAIGGAVLVGGVVSAFLYVRVLGLVGGLVVAAAGLVWVWFNGFSAANPDPEPPERHHGPLTQELGVTHAYRRAWIRHTWRVTNRRRTTDRFPDGPND